MYYYGYFRNNDTSKDSNGQLYKIVIITNFQNEEYTVGGELTLSDSPFTVEYQNEDNRLHKPYKCSMATVGLYQSDINYSFNSTRGNDVYVALLKLKEGVKFRYGEETVTTDKTNYTVEWCGFATPNAYSQNYESNFDLYELECQDALSTLQYFNYKTVADSQDIVTFYDIIRSIIAYLGTYTDIYITDGVKVPVNDINDNITNYLCVNERNFYDEDLKPEKMLDVLEKVLKYLSLTCIPCGNKLYLVNYDVLAKGYNHYHTVTYNKANNYHWVNKDNRIYSNWVTKGIVELEEHVEITPDLFAESGTKFSLGETYNSVKVVDDLYFVDGIDVMENTKHNFVKSTLGTYNITQVNDRGTGVNKYSLTVNKSDEAGTKITDGNGKVFFNKYYEFVSTPDIEIRTYWWKDNFSIDVVTEENGTEGEMVDRWIYEWNSSYQVNNKVPNYDTILNYTGAMVVDEAVAEDNLTVPSYKKCIYLTTGLQKSKTGGFAHYQNNNYVNHENARKQKVLEITLKNQTITKDDYIVLNGDYNFYKIAAPLSDYAVAVNGTGVNYVWAQLECDGKFWDGSKWQEKEPTEKVYLNGAGWVLLGKLFKLTLDGNATSASIPKNVGYPQGLTIAGWGVKVPFDGEGFKSVDAKLTLFRTFGLSYSYETELTVIKNFDFNIYSPVKDIFNHSSNTEYTNVIDSESIEEYQDIEFNITTYDGKEKDYSTVYITPNAGNTENINRLKTVFNLATGEVMTAEEHCISSICRQYNKPNTILTVNLKGEYKPYTLLNYHFFNGKTFVVDSITIDYAENCNTLTLVEKLTDNVVTNITASNKKREYQRNGEIIFNESTVKKDSTNITYTYNSEDLPSFELNNNGNLYIIGYGDTTL